MGCCAIGSSCIGLGRDHWIEMLDNPRKPVAQWYTLQETLSGLAVETKSSPIKCINMRWRKVIGKRSKSSVGLLLKRARNCGLEKTFSVLLGWILPLTHACVPLNLNCSWLRGEIVWCSPYRFVVKHLSKSRLQIATLWKCFSEKKMEELLDVWPFETDVLCL